MTLRPALPNVSPCGAANAARLYSLGPQPPGVAHGADDGAGAYGFPAKSGYDSEPNPLATLVRTIGNPLLIARNLCYKYPSRYRTLMAQLTLSSQPRAASVDFSPLLTASPRPASRQTSNRNTKLLESPVTYTKQTAALISNRNSFAFFVSARRAQASQFLIGTLNAYPLDVCHGKISHLTFSIRDKFTFLATWGGSVSAPCGKKRLEERGGFIRANPGLDFDAMVHPRMIEHREARTHRAPFGIVRAIDKTRDTGLEDRAGTHGAGLDRYIESCTQQAVIADRRRSGPERHHFRVGRGIAIGNRAIRSARQNTVRTCDHAANWHFPGALRRASFLER